METTRMGLGFRVGIMEKENGNYYIMIGYIFGL